MHLLLALFLAIITNTVFPLHANAIAIYDNYDAWAKAVSEPIAVTCMTGQECYPESFGHVASNSGNEGGSPGIGLGIDDGDWFRFFNNPLVRAVAFTGEGHGSGGDEFAFAISSVGPGIFLYSSTGFLGFVNTTPFAIGQITAAPRIADSFHYMYFNASAAPGFVNTAQVPEPSTLLQMSLALLVILCVATFRLGSRRLIC
jgi:hypothetical protein